MPPKRAAFMIVRGIASLEQRHGASIMSIAIVGVVIVLVCGAVAVVTMAIIVFAIRSNSKRRDE